MGAEPRVERGPADAPRYFGGAIGIGDRSTATRTVNEADLTVFTGLSGDARRIHLDAVYARTRGEQDRTVHESLLLAWMSATAGVLHERTGLNAVAYGLDTVRFLGSVQPGDRIVLEYEVVVVDEPGRKCYGVMRCRTPTGAVAVEATQIEYIDTVSAGSR